jgi:hypothetical protein
LGDSFYILVLIIEQKIIYKMKKLTSLLAIILLATNFAVQAQDATMQKDNTTPKLIAVVNRANWCSVCQANGQRFGAVLMPYAAKGVKVYMNDVTDTTTAAVSKATLETAGVYKAVTKVKRKGMGKMMESCGLKKTKYSDAMATGIVTFINATTHKQLKQVSIAITDEEMKTIIDNLLN